MPMMNNVLSLVKAVHVLESQFVLGALAAGLLTDFFLLIFRKPHLGAKIRLSDGLSDNVWKKKRGGVGFFLLFFPLLNHLTI
jgi:hypothetical protein